MSKVILFRGQAGTGKTTLSDALAARLRIPVLHKDDLYDSAAQYMPDHDARNALCFDVLYRYLANQLRAGADVIVDYGFNHTEAAQSFKLWVEERGGRLQSIRCVCGDDAVWASRLAERRANPQPNQRITDLTELKAHYRNSASGELEGELVVDTGAMSADEALGIIGILIEGVLRT